jgi:hypothetical protein
LIIISSFSITTFYSFSSLRRASLIITTSIKRISSFLSIIKVIKQVIAFARNTKENAVFLSYASSSAFAAIKSNLTFLRCYLLYRDFATRVELAILEKDLEEVPSLGLAIKSLLTPTDLFL